jgi:hypothetical protein
VQRQRVVRDAEGGVADRDFAIDGELAVVGIAVRLVLDDRVLVMLDNNVVVVDEVGIDVDVLVRDPEGREVGVVEDRVIVVLSDVVVVLRYSTVVVVRCNRIGVLVAVIELDDRTIRRVRVVVVVRREVQVRQHLHREQPQQGCRRRESAAIAGTGTSPHRR